MPTGEPFVLEPFQEFIVGAIFGWYNAAGFRRFRRAYVEMGKGNGKSPLAAGVGLYALLSDGQEEPDAQIYSAAVSREQAGIVFKDAVGMVENSPELRELIEVNAASLVVHPTRSVFRPVSSEHRGLDGKRVQIALVDELHEHPSALVVDKMRAGTKTRRNALIFEITNSGYDRTSVCWEHHELSIKILEKTQKNETWFAYVCALDEGDDWTDRAVWPKANPGVGTILPWEYLEEQVAEAIGMPSMENLVKRLNFCIWTRQATRWLDMLVWQECDEPRTPKQLVGKPCVGGLDLSSTSDITALSFLFHDEKAKAFDLVCKFWIPEASLEQETSPHSEQVRLDLLRWAQQGFITVTPGNVVDYDFIEKEIIDARDRYEIVEIAFDKWNSTQLVTHLLDAGAPMVEFGQGIATMNAPTKQFERLVKIGKLRHGNNPPMTWMASNVSVKQDPSGNVKPDKQTSGEKIDGPVSAIMALGVWMRRQKEEQPQPSIYSDPEARPHGLLRL